MGLRTRSREKAGQSREFRPQYDLFLKNLNPVRRIRELAEELGRTRRERDQARKETEHRQEEIERLQEENQQLQKENQRLQKENQRLRKDLGAAQCAASVRPLPSRAGSRNPIRNAPGVSLGRRMVPTLTGRSPIT